MDEAEKIILIDKLYIHEKILEALIKAIGYGFGIIPAIPHFIANGIVPTVRGFSKQSFSYCSNGLKIYRSMAVKDKELITEFHGVKTLNQYILRSGKTYASRRCIGRRVLLGKTEEYDSVNNKMLLKYTFGDFAWKTYNTVLTEVENISRFLIDNHYNSEKKFALFANTSPEWLTMTFALLNVSCPIVTVYSSLSDEAIQYAFELTQIQGVMVDEKTLPRLITFMDKLPYLKHVVVSTYIDDHNILPKTEPSQPFKFITFSDIASYKSETHPQCQEPQNPDDLALIMFTSGSTGVPKGVMISHRNIIAVSASVQNNKYINKYHLYAGFLPSSHVFEFFIELTMILFGCTIGFCTPLTLLDSSPMIKPGTKGDLVCLQPTLMIAVPLFLERVEKGIIQELKLKSRFKQILFQTCYSIKMFYRYYGFPTPILDRVVFKPLRNLLGGNIQLAYIGGAYISKSCEEFANICFGTFRQGYGLTETSSAVLFNNIEYLTSGTAGAPLDHCEVKLVPWEEGGCDPNDSERPTGEIAISGDCVTMGYYKNEELTRASYITDPDTGKRWFHTGDIGLVMPDGNIKIVDRKKDIVKLLHGEYVSLVKIESQLSSNPLIDIVCVLPNKSMQYLNAIVVPNRERTKKFLVKSSQAQESSDLQALLERPDIKELISQNIKSTSLNGLNRYEKPHEVHVIADIWTPESNLITPTIKIKRNEITKRYSHLLQ